MFGFASSVVLRGEGVLFSRLRCSGSRLLCMERALHCLRFQPSGPPQKHGLGCACVLRLPRRSGSGSQELAGRPLPSAAPAPVPARAGRVPVPRVSPRPSRQMSTIQNLRRSLVRDWRPVCSGVGAAVLGAEPAPFPSPCLLPPPGLGGSAACELFSGLARSLCSANSMQCVRAG